MHHAIYAHFLILLCSKEVFCLYFCITQYYVEILFNLQKITVIISSLELRGGVKVLIAHIGKGNLITMIVFMF